MPAHVSMICLSLVVKVGIVFWDRKCIHVSSESYAVDAAPFTIFLRLSLTSQIDNHASTGAVFDLTLGHAHLEKHLLESGMSLKFLKTAFGILMDLASHIDHVISF